MATVSTPQLTWAAREWDTNAGYASAVTSGIVPDTAHLARGGPHVSIEDLNRYGNAGDYSNRRPWDKAPPVKNLKAATAIDMSLSRADMKKLYARVEKVYTNRTDPRRRYINAINVWDGVDGHAPRRFNFQANTNEQASADHTWHSHADFPRYLWDETAVGKAGADKAARAFLSTIKGESKAAWLAKEEDDVATSTWTAEDWNNIRFVVLGGTTTDTKTGSSRNHLGAGVEEIDTRLKTLAEQQRLRDEAILTAVQDKATAAEILARVDSRAAEVVAAQQALRAQLAQDVAAWAPQLVAAVREQLHGIGEDELTAAVDRALRGLAAQLAG